MALTGAQVGQTCYASYNDAWDAHFLAMPRTVLANGDTVYYQKNTAMWTWERIEITPAGVITATTAPTPTFPMCDPLLGFNDGIALSLVIVAAMFSAISAGIISKAR